MSGRRVLQGAGALVLAGALALAAGTAVAGVAAGPPVSSLVLGPTDVPGAKVSSQQAGKSSAIIDGEYERIFKFATPYGASKFTEYNNTAILVHTVDVATLTYSLLAKTLQSASGKASLAKEAAGGSKGVTISAVKSHSVALGDGGVELTFLAHQTKPKRIVSASVIIFRVDRVIETGTAVGNGTPPQAADSLALATLVLNRVRGAFAPALVTVPAVTGTAQQGQLLAASNGTWTNSPTSYAYQWQHCDTAGANCADIAGATAFTYTVAPTDVGATLRVNVTATNAEGSTAAASAATAVVS